MKIQNLIKVISSSFQRRRDSAWQAENSRYASGQITKDEARATKRSLDAGLEAFEKSIPTVAELENDAEVSGIAGRIFSTPLSQVPAIIDAAVKNANTWADAIAALKGE